MVDFTNSLKKVIPSAGESRVLLGWGLATAVLIVIEYVVFSLASGTGVSSGRLPAMRMVSLGVGAYVVLMIRDIIAHYAGVSVDEMFTLSPVVVFGILVFMVGFLLYAIHDIQNVGTSVVRSSRKTGGNLLSFFFDNDKEGFEEGEEEDTQGQKQTPRKRVKVMREGMSSGPIGTDHYGPSDDPFQQNRQMTQATRTGQSQGTDIRDARQASDSMMSSQGGAMVEQGDMMEGGVSAGGLSYASF